MNKNRILLDIDNIIYDFASPLKVKLDILTGSSIPISKWRWDVWEQYNITKHKFYDIVSELHSRIDCFVPFSHVSLATYELSHNYYIDVVSHRKKEFYEKTREWLLSNYIYFDNLILTHKKEELISYYDVVIDDSPHVQLAALSAGKKVISFKYSWCLHDSRIVFLNDWIEILNFLRDEI